jgi:hypothetical protein
VVTDPTYKTEFLIIKHKRRSKPSLKCIKLFTDKYPIKCSPVDSRVKMLRFSYVSYPSSDISLCRRQSLKTYNYRYFPKKQVFLDVILCRCVSCRLKNLVPSFTQRQIWRKFILVELCRRLKTSDGYGFVKSWYTILTTQRHIPHKIWVLRNKIARTSQEIKTTLRVMLISVSKEGNHRDL